MSKDPAVLFYTSDFLTGTLTMSNEDVGKYIRLLCLQHQKGRLTEQDMYYICTTYVKEVFEKFKKSEDGLYYNERLEHETNRRKNYSESRRKNICKRYEPTYVVHMETETETEDVIKEKDLKKKNIVDRMKDLEFEVMAFRGEYPEEMLWAFYDYWSEPNQSKTKMKKELQKTWDTKRRLKTWKSNEEKFNAHKSSVDRGKGSIDVEKYERLSKLNPDF